jgi:hypothetical protein
MDFSQLATTDDLLQVVPPQETTEWEFKAADVFATGNFAQFKNQKLGRIVSSFANSGGGYLLLGRRDKSDVFDPVPLSEGRTSMEDHLGWVISHCVTPQYRDFSFHRLPITSSPTDSVLIVAFEDSPAAPHQSNADTNYFYRLPGHCVAAPHFYLEALRGRYTRAIVKAESLTIGVSIPLAGGTSDEWRGHIALIVTATISVRNSSLQIADPYALRIFTEVPDSNWMCEGNALITDTVLRKSQLFPSIREPFCVSFRLKLPEADLSHPSTLASALDAFEFSYQPLSQNFAGEVTRIRFVEHPGNDARQMVTDAIIALQEQKRRIQETFDGFRDDLDKIANTDFSFKPNPHQDQ